MENIGLGLYGTKVENQTPADKEHTAAVRDGQDLITALS